jgi:hypothetical protein
MNIHRQRDVLERIQNLRKDIERMEAARTEAAVNGYASASISSTNGSKSWTRMSLSEITKVLESLECRLESLRRLLKDRGLQSTIYQIWC